MRAFAPPSSLLLVQLLQVMSSDAKAGANLADTIDSNARRKLDALFKRIRSGHDERAALTTAIRDLIRGQFT